MAKKTLFLWIALLTLATWAIVFAQVSTNVSTEIIVTNESNTDIVILPSDVVTDNLLDTGPSSENDEVSTTTTTTTQSSTTLKLPKTLPRTWA